MAELIKNDMKKLQSEIAVSLTDIDDLVEGIHRSADRVRRLIKLNGPMPVVVRDIEMIQYRALSIQACYEALALLQFVYSDDKEDKTNEDKT